MLVIILIYLTLHKRHLRHLRLQPQTAATTQKEHPSVPGTVLKLLLFGRQMVSSCKLINYHCAWKEGREGTSGNASATSYTDQGIPFQQTAFISLEEANPDITFELKRKASEESSYTDFRGSNRKVTLLSTCTCVLMENMETPSLEQAKSLD